MSDQSTESGAERSTVSRPVPRAIRRRTPRILARVLKSARKLQKSILARRRRVAAAIILVLMGYVAMEPEAGQPGVAGSLQDSWAGSGVQPAEESPDDAFFEDYFERIPEFPDDTKVSVSTQRSSTQARDSSANSAVKPPEVPAFEPLDLSVGILETTRQPATDDESQPSSLLIGTEIGPDGVRPVKFRGTIVPLTK